MLVDGVWTKDWDPVQATDRKGGFVRQTSQFRHWVTPDGAPGPTGEGGFPAEPGRYLLYVALICPWACRTLTARKLKKLENVIEIAVASPKLSPEGWAFGGYPRATADPILGAAHLHQIYTASDPKVSGRATVPVLFDKQRRVIVNNESADILRMLNSAFDEWGDPSLDLYPAALRGDIDALNAEIYETLNNGVYRAGFATTQQAYEEAAQGVFERLDALEARLTQSGPYLFGSALTETDIRLFVTLARFDLAYHGLFKCNRRRLIDYPALAAYARRLHALPGVAETVDPAHIAAGYYSIEALNPNGIAPIGPASLFGEEAPSASPA